MYRSTTDHTLGQIVEFNLQAAGEKSYNEINAIVEKFRLKEKLATGKIVERVDNGDIWYINQKETLATLVTEKQLKLLHEWDKETLLPTEEQLNQLEKIGATSSSPYSLYEDAITYPCSVLTKDDQKIDLCLIVFTESPPLQRHYKNVLLFSVISRLEESELALSKELRRAATQAEEIRMSFAPFMVKTNKGKIITYDGVTHFASAGQIKGNEIECEIPFEYAKFDGISNVSFDDITFIIGKWDHRLQNIFNKTRSEQEKQQQPGHTQNGGRSNKLNIWDALKRLFKI